MNWDNVKDPLCYLCVLCSVVTPWALTHEFAGLNNPFNYKCFCHSV